MSGDGGGVDTSAQREQLELQREMLEMQRAATKRDEERLAEQRAREDAALRARRKGGGRSILMNDEIGILDTPATAAPAAMAA